MIESILWIVNAMYPVQPPVQNCWSELYSTVAGRSVTSLAAGVTPPLAYEAVRIIKE